MADITSDYKTTDGRPLGTPHFNDLEKRYSEERYTFVVPHFPAIYEDKRVLDVGCGWGAGTVEILRKGASFITAVDLNPVAIDLANEHNSDPKIEYKTADWMDLKDTYDIVVAVELVEHLTTKELLASLKHWHKLLTSQGMLYITTPKRRLPKESYPEGSHFTEYDLEELQDMIEPFGFTLVWTAGPQETDGISNALLFQRTK